MKKTLLISLLLFCSTFITGCMHASKNSEKANKEAEYPPSARHAKWQGTYQGILPCVNENCEGIAVMLVLDAGDSYKARTRMLGKEDKDQTVEGNFQWLADNNHINVVIPYLPHKLRIGNDFVETQQNEQYRLYRTN